MNAPAVLHLKSVAWLRMPPGRTLPCALATLGVGLGVELALLAFAPTRSPSFEKARSPGPYHTVEPEFSTGPSLLIQPRLEAPALRGVWQELVEQSRAAAAKGDTDSAIKLLEDAEAQVPLQPAALAEVAVQYEKCSAPARALKLWERIHQFGISAGVYYSAADAKLSLLQAHSSDNPRSETSGSGGLGKNGPLRLSKLSVREHTGSHPAHRNFTLEVPVQKLPGPKVEVRDVSIQVQFYDQINGRVLERTNAAIRWKWATAPVDWVDEPVETLEVDYRQGQSRSVNEERRYFGYVASVYYKDKLVDTRAEPGRLGQQYPPPRLLSREAAP